MDSMKAPVIGIRTAILPEDHQPPAAQSPVQVYDGLEVDHSSSNGIQVCYHDGIEIDRNRIHQWIEQDPGAPPNLLYYPIEGNSASTPLEDQEKGTRDLRQRQRLCGLQSRWFWTLVWLLALVVIGAGVGGGVGATVKHGTKMEDAAAQWRDSLNNTQYRVYVQSNEGPILEAAWSSIDPEWKTSQITENGADIAFGTPITVSVGYSHANTTLPLVKNVYFANSTGTMYERHSPQEGLWGNDNFSGLYTASDESSIFSFWYQSIDTQTQILAILFQDVNDNALSIAKYTGDRTSQSSWTSIRQSIDIQMGSALAVAPVGSVRTDLRLYMGDPNGRMKVYQYDLTSDTLYDQGTTIYDLPPQGPLSVSIQDNTNYFTDSTLPVCVKEDSLQYTHLIMFPTGDQSSLTLVSWNCSSGFYNQTARIEPLLHANRTYLGLADTVTSLNSSDQRVYVLFDDGDGPKIEEWQVPTGSQDADWKVLGTVEVSLT